MNCVRESFEIRSRDCDMYGRWTPGAILAAMQEAAGTHSTALGCGRETLVSKGIVWVIARGEFNMARTPRMGETVTLETFHMPARHQFFPRYFVFRDGEGNQVGTASTLWMLMDLNTRTAVSAETAGVENMDENRGTPLPCGMPGRMVSPEGEITESEYIPVFTEMDVNGHVNNTKYANWVCDLLGVETLGDKEIARMVLEYNAEIHPGEKVTFRFGRDDTLCRLTGIREGKTVFEVGCELRKCRTI